MAGREKNRVWAVFTPGPSTLHMRRIVVFTCGFFSAKSRTLASASTMSRSIGVCGGCGRPLDSVEKAGASCAGPEKWADDFERKLRTDEWLHAAEIGRGHA